MSVSRDQRRQLDHRRDLAERARSRLVDALEELLGDRFRSAGRRSEGDEPPLRVDPYVLVARCPLRSANPADDYVDSTATVRRRIGLLALRRAAEHGAEQPGRHDELHLADAVDETMRDRNGWPRGLREWVEGLDRAGRVAVESAALTWATDVVRLVGRGDRTKWSDPFRAATWSPPGRSVQLRGSTDAVIGGPLSGEKLLVISDTVPGPGDRLRAGQVAVVHALGSGRTPVRVSLGSPATGHIERVDVDDALVELVVDRILEVVGHLADPAAAPAAPGPWCSHCHLRLSCPEGSAFLGSRSTIPCDRRAVPTRGTRDSPDGDRGRAAHSASGVDPIT